MIKMTQLILLLTGLALVTAAPRNIEDEGKLQILTLTPEKLQARYYTSAEEGIEVRSEVGNIYNRVSVSTLDGTELVSLLASNANGAMLWKVMGSSVFLYNNDIITGQSGMAEYVVTPENSKRMEKEVKRNHITSRLLRHLNTEGINETKQLAFTELSARSEIEAVVELSKALGAADIKGYENEAALSFYVLALNLAKLLEFGSRNEESERAIATATPAFVSRRIEKRRTCSRPGWFGFGTIEEDGCSRCPSGSDCLGLCGLGCNCWSWVCGDCCYHRGCHQHDNCCDRNGYLHYTCLLANPFNFPCSGFTYQSECE